MTEFVGLKTKMYALHVDDKKDTKKVKDVKSNVVARTVTFNYTIIRGACKTKSKWRKRSLA